MPFLRAFGAEPQLLSACGTLRLRRDAGALVAE